MMTAPQATLVIAATATKAESDRGTENMAAQPMALPTAPPRYNGLRRWIRSDRYPKSGLAAAQHTIMAEQTMDARVAGRSKRWRRYGGPHRPVKDSIAPTSPPCARKISQVLRCAASAPNPLNDSRSVRWVRPRSSAGAQLANPRSDGSLATKAHAAAPTASTTPPDPAATARQPNRSTSIRSGTCAKSAPMLPMNRPRPDIVAKLAGGNQCVAIFSVTTQPIAVEPPTIRRPIAASP